MHNRQIMFLSKAGCRGIFREHARPQERFESQMEQKVPFGPSWPAPDGTFCSIWKSARIRTGRPSQGRLLRIPPGFRARPRHKKRLCQGTRQWGPPFSPLWKSGGEARIRTGVKALQASALPLGHCCRYPDSKTGLMPMERTTGLEPATPTWQVLYQLSHVRLRVINIRDAASGRKEFFKDC